MTYSARFRAKLWRPPGRRGWHFAPVPVKYAPRVTHSRGRIPVRVIVDGYAWNTSVWLRSALRPSRGSFTPAHLR